MNLVEKTYLVSFYPYSYNGNYAICKTKSNALMYGISLSANTINFIRNNYLSTNPNEQALYMWETRIISEVEELTDEDITAFKVLYEMRKTQFRLTSELILKYYHCLIEQEKRKRRQQLRIEQQEKEEQPKAKIIAKVTKTVHLK